MTVPAADDLRKFTFSDATAAKYMTTAADMLDAIDKLPNTIGLVKLDMPYADRVQAMERERGYADAMRQVKALLYPKEARRER